MVVIGCYSGCFGDSVYFVFWFVLWKGSGIKYRIFEFSEEFIIICFFFNLFMFFLRCLCFDIIVSFCFKVGFLMM